MKVAIIGIGNTLMSDDGVGVRVLEQLKGRIPEKVEMIELGTGGMNLLHILEGYDAVLLVDAVDFAGEPAEIRTFRPDDVSTIKTLGYSLHDMDLLKVIGLARQLGKCPEVIWIVSIQPVSLKPSMELSPEVESKLPELIETVSQMLSKIMGGA